MGGSLSANVRNQAWGSENVQNYSVQHNVRETMFPWLQNVPAQHLLQFISQENERWTKILANIRTNTSVLPGVYLKSEIEETLNHWYKLFQTHFKAPQQHIHGDQKKHVQGGHSLEKQNEFLQRQVEQLKQQLDSERSRAQAQGSNKQVHDTDVKDREIASLREHITQLETNMEQLEKENRRLRFSAINCDQVCKNESNLADLSDQNRPTKLGEMYEELYDNEWTDAFEELTKVGHSEMEAVETLKLTLMNVFSFCEKKADLLVHRASGAIDSLFEECETTIGFTNMKFRWMPKTKERQARVYEKTTLMSKQAKQEEIAKLKAVTEAKLVDLCRDIAVSMVPLVQQAYFEAYWNDQCIPNMQPFIRNCLFISWMMVVQAPPMVLEMIDEGVKFDKKHYREYTKSGPIVDYIVWPVMFLHKGGGVVSKGVAQGRSDETLGRCSPVQKD